MASFKIREFPRSLQIFFPHLDVKKIRLEPPNLTGLNVFMDIFVGGISRQNSCQSIRDMLWMSQSSFVPGAMHLVLLTLIMTASLLQSGPCSSALRVHE